MAETANETYPYVESDHAAHPGSLLGEELEVRGLSQRELARRMGRPYQVVSEIVRGRKAITAETALQLEAALEIKAHIWLGLQTDYDLVQARQKLAPPALAS